MTYMYFQDDDEESKVQKINLDDLFSKKQAHNIATLQTFNKILARIHQKIKTVANQKSADEHFCWFSVPEFVFGCMRYNHAECIAYLIDQLQTNGFTVQYYAPSLLLISWEQWVPAYVRTELKRKAGIIIDGRGNVEQSKEELAAAAAAEAETKPVADKKYEPIQNYKPRGAFLYNDELLDQINRKVG